MEIVDSDRVEIFFRQDEKLIPYYCLEMDARGRVLGYVARYYREFDYEWKWPVDVQLIVKASENSQGYVVEVKMTFSLLIALGLLINNIQKAGLYRGYCVRFPMPKVELRWISWYREK